MEILEYVANPLRSFYILQRNIVIALQK